MKKLLLASIVVLSLLTACSHKPKKEINMIFVAMNSQDEMWLTQKINGEMYVQTLKGSVHLYKVNDNTFRNDSLLSTFEIKDNILTVHETFKTTRYTEWQPEKK